MSILFSKQNCDRKLFSCTKTSLLVYWHGKFFSFNSDVRYPRTAGGTPPEWSIQRELLWNMTNFCKFLLYFECECWYRDMVIWYLYNFVSWINITLMWTIMDGIWSIMVHSNEVLSQYRYMKYFVWFEAKELFINMLEWTYFIRPIAVCIIIQGILSIK